MNSAFRTRVVVLAKAPLAGRSKTRLTPPYSPQQAAAIAQASLQDTLDVVRSLAADCAGWESLLCLDGEPGPWLPAGVPVIPQCPGGHDVRIAQAIEDASLLNGARPADAVVLIGMDTPQVTLPLLRKAAQVLQSADAVLGPADDGGWWLLGLRAAHAQRARGLIVGVPTSTPHTGALQRERLQRCGLRVGATPALRDIDVASDIDAVLDTMSDRQRSGRLAKLVGQLRSEAAA